MSCRQGPDPHRNKACSEQGRTDDSESEKQFNQNTVRLARPIELPKENYSDRAVAEPM